MELDDKDRRILDLLQIDARRTNADLARKVGLSASAVRRRVEKLREEKLIVREVAILDDQRALTGITVVVLVRLGRDTASGSKAFRARMNADSRVLQCYLTSGSCDYVLLVAAESPEDYSAWSEKALGSDSGISGYESLVVWSTVKSTTRRPLDFA